MARESIIRNPSWWKRRTTLERKLIIGSVCIFVFAFVLFVLLMSQHAKKDEICTTPECVQAASRLIDTIDKTVDPCDNFYNFVCGKFVQNTIIPEDKVSIDQFELVDDLLTEQLRPLVEEEIIENEPKPFTTMKKFYKACMNTENLEEIGTTRMEKILLEAGGWPVIHSEQWNETNFDWKKTVVQLRKNGYSANNLLSFYVGTDYKDSNARILNLDEASLSLARELLIEGLNNSDVKAYFKFMVDVAVVFGADKRNATEELMECLNFEIKLVNITLPRELRRNVTRFNNPMKISEIQSKYPSIDWLTYINNLLSPTINVTSDEIININEPDFIDKLLKLLSETPKRVQANFLLWRAVYGSITYMTEELRNLQLVYTNSKSGTTVRAPRWRECVETAAGGLQTAASAFYVHKYFDEDAKSEAVKMVKNIKALFLETLQNLDWMDEKTKQKAIEKAKGMHNYIGYPEQLKNITKIEEMYDGLDADSDDYLGSAFQVALFLNKFDEKRLRIPVSEDIWTQYSGILSANAYYTASDNCIEFPAGILQGVFFNKNRPKYMNYGAIGFVIGHEITHGFDDTGRQRDKDGNLADWWDPGTKDKFVQKAQCIIDQYGNYSVPALTVNGVQTHLNGIATQGETIADNGGIKQAYLAYEKWVQKNAIESKLPGLSEYTPNQLFWISCANSWCEKYRTETLKTTVLTSSHPPAAYRILGAFSNMEQFSKDFNCKLGSNMNPTDKCSVW